MPQEGVMNPSDPRGAHEWRPVAGFEAYYEVSERGDVFSIRSGRLLSPRPHPHGYTKYQLNVHGKTTYAYAHRIVAEVFGAPGEGPVVRHMDGNPANNHVSNLAYGTQRDNAADAVAHGTLGPGTHRRTHCINGHDFREHGYVRTNGYYACRTCNNARLRKRRAEKGRKGRPWPPKDTSKITRDDAEQIRRLRGDGVAVRLLMDKYGISKSQVHRIVKGRSWA